MSFFCLTVNAATRVPLGVPPGNGQPGLLVPVTTNTSLEGAAGRGSKHKHGETRMTTHHQTLVYLYQHLVATVIK